MPVDCTHCGRKFSLQANLNKHIRDHSGRCKDWPIAARQQVATTRQVAFRRPVQTTAAPAAAGHLGDGGADDDEHATPAAAPTVHDLNGMLWRYCMTCNAGRGLNDTDRLGLLELVAQFHEVKKMVPLLLRSGWHLPCAPLHKRLVDRLPSSTGLLPTCTASANTRTTCCSMRTTA